MYVLVPAKRLAPRGNNYIKIRLIMAGKQDGGSTRCQANTQLGASALRCPYLSLPLKTETGSKSQKRIGKVK